MTSAALALPTPPAETGNWLDRLKWCVAMMDRDDPNLAFAASLLSFAAKGGLTERQIKYAQRIYERLISNSRS